MPRPVVPILPAPFLAARQLARPVERGVIRQDQRAGLGDLQPARARPTPACLEFVDSLPSAPAATAPRRCRCSRSRLRAGCRRAPGAAPSSCRAMTSVCPALCPPWKRTTPCAWSVSQSTILPLPSSPHWVPITTTFLAMFAYICAIFCLPLSVLAQRPARGRSPSSRAWPRGPGRSTMTTSPAARTRDRLRQQSLVRRIRRADAPASRGAGATCGQLAQVHAEAGRRPRAAEGLADLVVASAQRHRVGHTAGIGREHHAAVVVIAAQVGQIDADRKVRCPATGAPGRRARREFPGMRQRRARPRENGGIAVEPGQRAQRFARRGVQTRARGLRSAGRSFASSASCSSASSSVPIPPRRHRIARNIGDVPEIQAGFTDPARGERRCSRLLDLQVAFDAGVAVDLGADLQRLARGIQAARAGVQHAAAIAQARDALAVQQMRVDARHLRRDVGAHAHHAAGELVHQLEGAQVQVVAGAGQQRLQVLEQRRHHQLVAVHAEQLQQPRAQRIRSRAPRAAGCPRCIRAAASCAWSIRQARNKAAAARPASRSGRRSGSARRSTG